MNRLMDIARRVPALIRLALFLALTLYWVWLFPSQAKLHFDIRPGQTWRFDDLTAPFDFAVRRSAAELERAQQRVLQDFSPYYRINPRVQDERIALFEQNFRAQVAQLKNPDDFPDVLQHPDAYLTYGKRLLRHLFERGILNPTPEHAQKGKTFVINVIDGNTSRQRTLEYFYTVQTAQAALVDSLPASNLAEPDFLYPLLEKSIVPNVEYDAVVSENFRQEALKTVPQYRGMVRKGELIVPRNGLVTEEVWQKISSMQEHYEEEMAGRSAASRIQLGYLLLALLLAFVYYFYLRNRDPAELESFPKLTFLLIWMVVYAGLVYWAEQNNPLNAYFIPFCIGPIVVQTFYNKRLALFTHLITVLVVGFISSLGWDFTFLQILAGIVILLTNVDVNSWSRFFMSIFAMLAVMLLAFISLTLIEQGSLAGWNWTALAWIFLSAFLTLLALPLVPLLERIFGFVSPLRLRDLTDLNRPLLQQLALKAPGTLQHSIQVGNLCEAAAREIGADALLVKVGALYHDIGKMLNPEFFVENQTGQESPHAGRSPQESAQIIISHVTEGVQMARKYRLPKNIIDFIETHHGTTRVEYFYRKMLNEWPDTDIPDADYRYPGPKPRTKEQTIMMMADSIEAACRSLKNPTEQAIFELIDKIIDGKINMGQMQESALSFQELEICRQSFRKTMRSVHHQRIEYPEVGRG